MSRIVPVLLLLLWGAMEAPEVRAGDRLETGFVGTVDCIPCHQQQADAWRQSHHRHAMHKATEAFVRGDFNDVSFRRAGQSFRFYRKGGRYHVETAGIDGEIDDFTVQYTFGWAPLQQYLLDIGDGKLQALDVAWDTVQNRWFVIDPEVSPSPGDWLHWTGGAMNWNTMCADCHSTNVKQNYDAATDSFETTWSDINVGCEACHGPGRAHADLMASGVDVDEARLRADLRLTGDASARTTIDGCAPCHSLREKLTNNYPHDGNWIDHFNPQLPLPPAYFPDGQIRQEVYVYGSFLQSRMFREGVDCNDCHDPHSLNLKGDLVNNGLCLQCHEQDYAARTHHFHAPDTAGSQCIACHMPGRYYMGVDFRRDHSFRVPRPDLSVKHGVPNACDNCHQDRSSSWAANKIIEWYGEERASQFSDVLVEAAASGRRAVPALEDLIHDTDQPAIVRATATRYLGAAGATEALNASLADNSPLVRRAAIDAFPGRPPLDALKDPFLPVRIAAAGKLAALDRPELPPPLRPAFDAALDEYREYLDASRYFPAGLMNRGVFMTRRGNVEAAVDAYEKVLAKDALFNPARVNLAHLYNRMGRNGEAWQLLSAAVRLEPDDGGLRYSLGLLASEMGRLDKAAREFGRAAALMPTHSRVRYNLAVALQQTGKPVQAEQAWLEAIALEPDNPEYHYGICTLYLQQQRPDQALPHVHRLLQLDPGNPRYRNLSRVVDERLE